MRNAVIHIFNHSLKQMRHTAGTGSWFQIRKIQLWSIGSGFWQCGSRGWLPLLHFDLRLRIHRREACGQRVDGPWQGEVCCRVEIIGSWFLVWNNGSPSKIQSDPGTFAPVVCSRYNATGSSYRKSKVLDSTCEK